MGDPNQIAAVGFRSHFGFIGPDGAADGSIIGSAVINDAPFKANRITEYSGPLFGSDGKMALSLNGTWDDSYQGTW